MNRYNENDNLLTEPITAPNSSEPQLEKNENQLSAIKSAELRLKSDNSSEKKV